MGMVSAAEARLDAAIRPEITVLRSGTSYPVRHRTAESASRAAGTDGGGPGDPAAEPAVPGAAAGGAAAGGAAAGGAAVGTATPGMAQVRSSRPPAPLRLTRRGRVVVAVLVVIVAVAAAGLLWLVVAGQAQASNHIQPGRPVGQGMLRVVVQPGQTLWSIAVRAEPSADPRTVIQEIIDANSLSGPAIQAGQVLWVPRG